MSNLLKHTNVGGLAGADSGAHGLNLCLREDGVFYDAGGEPIRRVVGTPRHYSDLSQLVRQMRKNSSFISGQELPDETYKDEFVREIVVRYYPNLIYLLPDVPLP